MAADGIAGLEELSVAFVQGSTLHEVGELLGFRWDTERQASWVEAGEQSLEEPETALTVQVEQRAGWLVLVEQGSVGLADQELVARLSRSGAAVSVWWTVDALMRVVVARAGVVVRSLDPLVPGAAPVGDPLPEEAGLVFGRPGAARVALELAERVTGVRLGRDRLLDTRRRTWTAGPVPMG